MEGPEELGNSPSEDAENATGVAVDDTDKLRGANKVALEDEHGQEAQFGNNENRGKDYTEDAEGNADDKFDDDEEVNEVPRTPGEAGTLPADSPLLHGCVESESASGPALDMGIAAKKNEAHNYQLTNRQQNIDTRERIAGQVFEKGTKDIGVEPAKTGPAETQATRFMGASDVQLSKGGLKEEAKGERRAERGSTRSKRTSGQSGSYAPGHEELSLKGGDKVEISDAVTRGGGRENPGRGRDGKLDKGQKEYRGGNNSDGVERASKAEKTGQPERSAARKLSTAAEHEDRGGREGGSRLDAGAQGREGRAERSREGRRGESRGWERERGWEMVDRERGGRERERAGRDRMENERYDREFERDRERQERERPWERAREKEKERERAWEWEREKEKERAREGRRERGGEVERDGRDRERTSEKGRERGDRNKDKDLYRDHGKEYVKGVKEKVEKDGKEGRTARREEEGRRSKRARDEPVSENSRQIRVKDDVQVDKPEDTSRMLVDHTVKPDAEANDHSSALQLEGNVRGKSNDPEKHLESERESGKNKRSEGETGVGPEDSHDFEMNETKSSVEKVSKDSQKKGEQVADGSAQETREESASKKVSSGKDGSENDTRHSEREARDRRERRDNRDERAKIGDRRVDANNREDRRSKEDRASERRGLAREDSSRKSDRRSPTHKRPRSRSRSPRRPLLADIDSRYRKFGGGRSGLGGYSPRRRRTSPEMRTPSPHRRSKSKSPEKKKVRTWDQGPPGMSASVAAAMQQYVQAQQAVSQATAAQQAAAKAQQALAAAQSPFGLAALGLPSSTTTAVSLLTPLSSMSLPNSLTTSLPSVLSGSLQPVLTNVLPASLQELSAAIAASVSSTMPSMSGASVASALLGSSGTSGLASIAAAMPNLAASLSPMTPSLSALSSLPATSSAPGAVSTSLPGLASALAAGMPSISPMLASLLPQMAGVTAVNTPVLSQATRPARRLYVGNMPATVSDGELMEFINAALMSVNANHLPGTKPCINCSVNPEKGYAFAEFITPEDAVAALALDGISLHGTTLKIRRPKDYVPSPTQTSNPLTTTVISEIVPSMDLVSSTVVDSPYKVFIGGISPSLPVEKVKEIITAFGQLRAFRMETDTSTRPARAFAFAEYMDLSVTSAACTGLNGLKLGPGVLTVCRATPNAPLQAKPGMTPFYGIPEEAKPLMEPPTRIVELMNMFTAEELCLNSDDDYQELEEDIRIECAKLGNVKSLHIVRPSTLPEKERRVAGDPAVESLTGGLLNGDQQVSGESTIKVEAKGQECAGKEATSGVSLDSLQIQSGESIEEGKVLGRVQPNAEANLGKGVEEVLLRTENGDAEDKKMPYSQAVESEGKPAENISGPVIAMEKAIEGRGREGSPEIGQEGKKNDAHVEAWRVGRVYVEFSREESACKAAHALHGRSFNGRKIRCAYLPLRLYQRKFKKGLQPRTVEEKQALALAVQSHLTSHL